MTHCKRRQGVLENASRLKRCRVSSSGKLKGLLACCVDSKFSIVAFVWFCFRYFVIMKRPYQECI